MQTCRTEDLLGQKLLRQGKILLQISLGFFLYVLIQSLEQATLWKHHSIYKFVAANIIQKLQTYHGVDFKTSFDEMNRYQSSITWNSYKKISQNNVLALLYRMNILCVTSNDSGVLKVWNFVHNEVFLINKSANMPSFYFWEA